MKYQSHRLYFFLALLLLWGLAACSRTENATPLPVPTISAILSDATETPSPPAPTSTPTVAPPSPTPTPLPTDTPLPLPTATPTPSPLQIAQSATVRVVVEGSQFLETLIGSGSGVIYDSSGLVVTNNHLVEGAGLVQVMMEGRAEPLAAQVIGRSACDDLAVLQLLGSDFPAAALGTTAETGSPVQVIGYPQSEMVQTVVESSIAGIDLPLSAGFANLSGTLQLVSPLDTGFSGAPVLDSEGFLTGIIVHTGSDSQVAAAMPVAALQPILAQLEQGTNLNWAGLNAGQLSAAAAEQAGVEPGEGLFVYAVDFRGPAGQAGVRIGDFITEIGGADVTGDDGLGAFCSALRESQPEEALDITVVRGETRYLGQLNGDPLAEEVIVVETAPDATPTPAPPVNSPKTELLGVMQRTETDMRNLGGTIDTLISNGCLAPPGEEPPAQGPPALNPEAHPSCVHSVAECQSVITIYNRVTNPPAVNLAGASGAVINANNSLQAAIARFDEGVGPFAGACQSFIQDPNFSIGSNIFAFARFAIDEALNILSPAIQGLINS